GFRAGAGEVWGGGGRRAGSGAGRGYDPGRCAAVAGGSAVAERSGTGATSPHEPSSAPRPARDPRVRGGRIDRVRAGAGCGGGKLLSGGAPDERAGAGGPARAGRRGNARHHAPAAALSPAGVGAGPCTGDSGASMIPFSSQVWRPSSTSRATR